MRAKFFELRVCLLLIGCTACLFSIFRTIWTFYGETLCDIVVNDLASHL